MREYLESLRAIWDTFQTDARLRYRSEHYTFRLMAPFFNPGPIEAPDIPIFLSGPDPALCQLAAEKCQGVLAPVLHSPSYLKTEFLPAIGRGLELAARERSDFEVAAPVFVVSGRDESERVRAKIAATSRLADLARASASRGITTLIGWEEIANDLKAMATSRRWETMTEAIAAEALEEVAIVARPSEVRAKIEERYSGVVDRVCVCVSHESAWLMEAIRSA